MRLKRVETVEFIDILMVRFVPRRKGYGPGTTDEQNHSSSASITDCAACAPRIEPRPALSPEAMETVSKGVEALPKEIFRESSSQLACRVETFVGHDRIA
jgi:hypothetical protein